MATYLLKSLRSRRETLAAKIEAARQCIETGTDELAHLDATIADLQARAAQGRSTTPRAKISRYVLSILRTANGPMTVRAITSLVLHQRGEDGDDQRLVTRTMERVRMALLRQKGAGVVQAERDGRGGAGWRLTR